MKLSDLILDMFEAKTAYLEALDNHEGDINAQILYEDWLKTLEALDAWRPEP